MFIVLLVVLCGYFLNLGKSLDGLLPADRSIHKCIQCQQRFSCRLLKPPPIKSMEKLKTKDTFEEYKGNNPSFLKSRLSKIGAKTKAKPKAKRMPNQTGSTLASLFGVVSQDARSCQRVQKKPAVAKPWYENMAL
jgi:hypothetical protein